MSRWVPIMICMLAAAGAGESAAALRPVVEAEEEVYRYQAANNGAGPLWCKGSTCLVRDGDQVFASGLELIPELKPLNNVRWTLYRREAQGWVLAQRDEQGRTREPCPLATLGRGRLMLSVNPTLTAPNTYNGPALPQVLQFAAADPRAPARPELPAWEGHPPFTEHSYRGLAADGRQGELLLFNIQGHVAYHWSFRDRAGHWSARGRLEFPMGTDYEKPEPIRLCYPVLALRDRAVYVLGISDIIEPVSAWRAFKRELTGQEWDYDFRRLFFTWTPDVTTTPFAPWEELASRERTAGNIDNLDLWVAGPGEVHVLWRETSLDPRLREKFFPGERLTYALEHCLIRGGRVVSRDTLARGGEGESGEIPGVGRFQATPQGRLFVCYYCSGANAAGQPVSENRLVEILPEGKHGTPVRLPLAHPLSSFMTATERAGCAPSPVLEMLGVTPGEPYAMRYARVRIR